MIENLKPHIQQITSAPLPVIPGGDLEFYLQIEGIRCQAATQICANWLEKHDDAESLESIRADLLKRYPACADLLTVENWPYEQRKH